jgi:hypothetical protein
MALVLVFAGTLAQVHLGLYAVQAQFFHSFLVYWTPAGTHFKIPVFPGGWLLGWLLMVNLLTAHVTRFRFGWKKSGILIVHAGLILLLLGQFFTEIFSVESQMRLEVGGSKSYTEDSRRNELVVIDITDPNRDSVVSIPESIIAHGGDVRAPALPFVLRVKKYFANSQPAGPMSGDGDKLKADNGLGNRLLFTAAPAVTRLDDENKPAAVVEVVTDKGSLGSWTVSTWMTKYPWVTALQGEVGGILNQAVDDPQIFTAGGRTYELALRPIRYYQPFTITLLQFKHDVYPGTDIPSNFSSKIHLSDPSRGEDRDVLIYMNSPLRYHGLAFYQASFEPGDRVSILQVVRNPASVTPYVACALIGLGLCVQFCMHLFAFAKKRLPRAEAAGSRHPRPAKLQPQFASTAGDL